MYLAGVSVRRVEDITEALWGAKVSSSTVSDLNQKIYSKIESWRMQPIHGEHPYIFVDGVYLKRSWGGEVQNVSVLVAIGVNAEGYREILGVAEGSREDKESWSNFFRYLKDRGLKGVKLVISDKASGWEGFQELVAASDLEDKDLIIRVLSMYSDPAVREKEIKNMSAVYSTLAKDVLPELRRARFIANVEFQNYTNEELLQLITDNIDVLDETALLRAATLVKENDQKIEIYKKAAEKFESATAKYNMAVVYIWMNEIDKAAAALKGLEMDADWQNAMGVIALHKGQLEAANNYFKKAEPFFDLRFKMVLPHLGQRPGIFSTMGLVFLHSGNPGQAKNFPNLPMRTTILRPHSSQISSDTSSSTFKRTPSSAVSASIISWWNC